MDDQLEMEERDLKSFQRPGSSRMSLVYRSNKQDFGFQQRLVRLSKSIMMQKGTELCTFSSLFGSVGPTIKLL